MGLPLRDKFVDWVLSKEGCWYCWPTEENGYSGKDLKSAKYKNVYDCSGLVTSGLYHVTNGKIDWRVYGNTKNLIVGTNEKPALLKPITEDDAVIGDLAFYGYGKNMPNHVMILMGNGMVFGACGGNRDVTTPELAMKKGARVRFRDSPFYRPDFLGFWKNPL